MLKRISTLLLILFITISVIGCGSTKSNESTMAMADQVASDNYGAKSEEKGVVVTYSQSIKADNGSTSVKGNAPEEPKANESQNVTSVVDNSQKVIFTGQIDLETLDFEKTIAEISDYVGRIGGYAQSSSVHGGRIGYTGLRSAEYVFRIPKTKYTQSFIDFKDIGTVVFERSSGEDITDRYFDTEARLKSLKIQQERLMALLDKADKMEDILKIEKELQTTLYEIENYTGTIKKWDSLIEYSTLSVNVREVKEIKPEVKDDDGLFRRIAVGFKNSILGVWDFLQSFLVFIASALPVIIPLGVLGYIGFRIIRKKVKKNVVKNVETDSGEK